jgi:U3 small nucleolar RNA-associated protein 4
MTTSLHRVRFVEYQPEAVNALAFDHNGTRLAVARSSSDIELWNVRDGWRQELGIIGEESSLVRSLVWSNKDGVARLFGGGLNGMVIEYDLERLRPKHIRDSFGGGVWSLCINSSQTKLAVGCEDGCIRLFTIEDGGLEYQKSFQRTDARVLSLAWHCEEELMYSGGADGMIRCWNVKTGRNTSRMVLESYGSTPTLVWCLMVFRDLTVVSGDSLGHVQIWEGAHGTLRKSFSEHTADVVAIAASANGQAIFASGYDNKVVMLRKADTEWVISHSCRPHTHDIKAMACAQIEGRAETLVTAGVDTSLFVYKTKAFLTERPRKILPLPQRPLLQLATEKRLLMVQYPHRLDVWKLVDESAYAHRLDGDAQPQDKGKKAKQTGAIVAKRVRRIGLAGREELMVQLHFKKGGPGGASTSERLVCSAMSSDGRWVACSDSTSLKVFKLPLDDSGRVTKVKVPEECAGPARLMHFVDKSSTLVLVTEKSAVKILTLEEVNGTNDSVQVTLKHAFAQPVVQAEQAESNSNSNSSNSGSVCTLASSADGQWVATGDSDNTIHIFNTDSAKRHWTLPILDSTHTTFAFHHSSSTLVVMCASNRFYIFDVEERKPSDWTVKFGEQLPSHFLGRRDKFIGILFDATAPTKIVFYSHSGFCRVDLNKPIVSQQLVTSKQPKKKAPPPKKRKKATTGANEDAEDAEADDNFKFTQHIKPIMFMAYLGEREAVIVECPWLKVMQRLPDMLRVSKYGT